MLKGCRMIYDVYLLHSLLNRRHIANVSKDETQVVFPWIVVHHRVLSTHVQLLVLTTAEYPDLGRTFFQESFNNLMAERSRSACYQNTLTAEHQFILSFCPILRGLSSSMEINRPLKSR